MTRPATILLSADGRTGQLVAELAARRGHAVRSPSRPHDARTLRGADAVVLIPRRGDPRRHAHGAVRSLVAAARRHAPAVHVVLVTSFAVGYGTAHPLMRVNGGLPGHPAAERALRESGLDWTIVRPTWLTDDPAGAHAVTVTQDPRPDGMLARADLAAALVAAVEQPVARRTTFALYNEPGTPSHDWARTFAALARDEDAIAS